MKGGIITILIFIVCILGACTKKHCWVIKDVNGVDGGTICDKTEDELKKELEICCPKSTYTKVP